MRGAPSQLDLDHGEAAVSYVQLEADVGAALGAFRRQDTTQALEDEVQGGAWLAQLRPSGT